VNTASGGDGGGPDGSEWDAVMVAFTRYLGTENLAVIILAWWSGSMAERICMPSTLSMVRFGECSPDGAADAPNRSRAQKNGR
jgi:hypothetical protein